MKPCVPPIGCARSVEAIGVLETNRLIGRPAISDKRELVIGHGSHGYVVLCRYVSRLDMVLVLAMRGRREAGFAQIAIGLVRP